MAGREAAETLALEALTWLLAEDGRAARFLAATGAAPADLARAAGDAVFLGAVLDVLLADEALVVEFCREAGRDPGAPLRARAALPGGDAPHWT